MAAKTGSAKKKPSGKPAAKSAAQKKSPPSKSMAKKPLPKKPLAKRSPAKKPSVKTPASRKPVHAKPAKAVAKKSFPKKPAAKTPSTKLAPAKQLPAKQAGKAPPKVVPKAPLKVVPKAPQKIIVAKPVQAPRPLQPVKALKGQSSVSKMMKPSQMTETEQAPERPKRPRAAAADATIVPPDYDPRKDKGEFMSAVMLEYFRQKLIRWREELVRESSETIHNTLQSTELQKPDLADRAAAETDHALELRARDRERKLIAKINEALLRIEDGEYGYCEETGEPINVARLDARPIATLSIEAQERHERLEKTHRDE